MVELDLGKVVMNSYNDLDNKPKINGVELKGELKTSEFGIDQAIEAVNLARLNFKELNTLEEFVNETAKENDVPHFSTMWDGGGWGPLKRATHYKYLIAYEGRYNNPGSDGVIRDDVRGSGLFWDNENNIWYVTIQGNVGTLTFSYFKIEPNQIPTNNLLATEAGTALDAVQGKALYDRDVDMSVGRLQMQAKNKFATIEEFIQETAKSINIPVITRIQDSTGAWGPGGKAQWYKCLVVYQNPYGSQFSLGGAGFMWDDAGNKWSIEITGNSNTTINFKYKKLVTETELNNRINNYAFSSYRVGVDTNYGMETILGIFDSNGISTEIKQLGITLDDTLEVALSKIFINQRNAYIRLALNTNTSVFNKSLPKSGAGVLEIHKVNQSRGFLRLFTISDGEEFTNNYINNALGTWQKINKTNV